MRPLFVTWGALLALLALTVASAYVPLGWFNTVLNIAIAIGKAGLVMGIFMQLIRAERLIRLFALATFCWIVVLIALTLTDTLTQPGGPLPTVSTDRSRDRRD